MKAHGLDIAIAIGILICGRCSSGAQVLPFAVPFVVQVAEVDRYHVFHFPQAKPMQTKVGLVFKDLNQSEVLMLVKYGLISRCPVMIIDGHRLIAESRVEGMQIASGYDDTVKEYGFMLGFSSAEEADRVTRELRLQMPVQTLDGMIRRHKRDLDDQRGWVLDGPGLHVAQMWSWSITAVEPTIAVHPPTTTH